MRRVPKSSDAAIKITRNVGWAADFWKQLLPLKDQIVNHWAINDFSKGKLSAKHVRKTLIGFYPIVKLFRNYMGLNLKKVRPNIRAELTAGKWLEENIHVEAKHAQYWIFWGTCFGCTRDEFENAVWNRDIKIFDKYLCDINANGSLAEGLAATNLAIEWPTGEWAEKAHKGMDLYFEQEIAKASRHGMRWIKAHEVYDDAHPYEAMELIKHCATDLKTQDKALVAAKRGMTYYLRALNSLSKS